MVITKEQIIVNAYSAIGLDNYVYDLSPEEMQTALNMLDFEILNLESLIGIRYSVPNEYQQSSLDDKINILDAACFYIVLSLGLQMASALGKPVGADIRTKLKKAENNMFVVCSRIPRQPLDPRTPVGAGNESPNIINAVFVY